MMKNGNEATVNGGQKQHQTEKSNKVYTKHHGTLSEYKMIFQEIFTTGLTQTEIQSIFLKIHLQKDSMSY